MLSRRHGTKRVRATLVYNEFIAHKTHTHMNATQWETLTSFVLYLGKVGTEQVSVDTVRPMPPALTPRVCRRTGKYCDYRIRSRLACSS